MTRLTSAVSNSEISTVTGQTSRPILKVSAHAAADTGVQDVTDGFDPLGKIDRLRIDALAPRECQQLAGQGRAALYRGLDGCDRALQSGVVANTLLQGVDAAADDHQQVVEVVGHAASKLAERVELLQFREMLLHLFEFELGVTALGDVAGDLGKADQSAVFMDRIDDHAGPEEGAVLADAPAFLFVAAVVFRDLQRACGLAVGAVGLGVEAGKMLAEDFPGRITLDPLAADVPARDDAGGIEHVKRVVGDTFNEKSETAFTLG